MMTRAHVLSAVLAASAYACTTEATPPSAPVATAQVAKIVFVGKTEACDCTKNRITNSWTVLQRALAAHQEIPVERLRVDSDPAKVAPYQEIRALMVIPGVYFLDASGGIVELLQGELSEEQITRLL